MFNNRILLAVAVCSLTLAAAGCGRTGPYGLSDEQQDEWQDEMPDEMPDRGIDVPVLTVGSSHSLPSVSGLVHHRGALYLAIHDTKSDDDGPRLSVVRVDRQGAPAYRHLELDWQSHGGPSHDLESIAAIPGRTGEYLAAESKNRGAERRRILHLEVSGSRLQEVEARLVGAFELPGDVKNVEGMAIVPLAGRPAQLGLCERNERKGDSTRSRDKQRYAFIRWAELNFDGYSLTSGSVTRLRATSWPAGKGLRTCSELYFDREASRLWVAAALDDDDQPFGSMIFRMHFDASMLESDAEWWMTPLARIPGLKVEAIAAPILPTWGPTLGSDGDGDPPSGLIWPVKPGSLK